MATKILNENKVPIGWSEETPTRIRYFTYKYGCIGIYHKDTGLYIRYKSIPGKPDTPFRGTGDYGENDVRYWGE